MNANEKSLVAKAMAVIQRRGLPVGRTAAMKRVCAVHGTAYAAVYREINGRWRLEECVRATSASGPVGSRIVIDAASVEDGIADICPWCGCGPKIVGEGAGAYVRCGRCQNLVCLGRTDGLLFKCCDQCGNVAKISGFIAEFEGWTRNLSPRGMMAGDSRPALASPARLRLSAGKRS